MPDIGIKVTGADELRKALRRAGDAGLKRELAGANKAAAQLVVDRALPNVPIRTGKLKRSTRALGSQRSGRAVAGTARVPYAAAIHWGRGRGNVGSPPGNHPGRNVIRGRPFLWDAAQKSIVRVARTYEAAIEDLINRAIRGTRG